MFSLTLAAVVSTLLITSSPLRGASTDSRIESSAARSYTFKTTLKDDSIKTESKDGVVTLTGTVAETSHKSLAEDTVAACPASRAWTINLWSVANNRRNIPTLGSPPKLKPHCFSIAT